MKKSTCLYVSIFAVVIMSSSCIFQSKELFSTSEFDHHYKWTLTSRLGQALEMAESKYGQRDQTWTLLGVEIYDKNVPQTWYLNENRGQKQIIIRLSRYSTLNRKAALFELSHEVIHLLSPQTGKRTVSAFEEGLAVYYSIQFLEFVGMNVNPDKIIKDPKYLDAYNQVINLYTRHEKVDDKVKLLRTRYGGFSTIPATAFKKTFPGFSETFYSRLAAGFSPSV